MLKVNNSRFLGLQYQEQEQHHKTLTKSAELSGVLITNLGTPDAATTVAVRRYLAEFLWDPRVVEIPRLIWWCILHGIILRVRPKKSAALYQSIWTEQGSPLLNVSQQQAKLLQQALGSQTVVKLGMRYGNPSIASALRAFQESGIGRILVLPLYPQYGGPTTGATFDAVVNEIKKWRWVPEFHFYNHYHDHPLYIKALCNSIDDHIKQHGMPQKLLFSYHGMPQRFLLTGDPYYCQSIKITRLVTEQLNLKEDQVISCFQSRFGKAKWLQPYTDQTLKKLAQQGITQVAVICPAFSADCLETLEEIKVTNKQLFLAAGGKQFHYIAALNTREDHIKALAQIIQPYLKPVHDRNECSTIAAEIGEKAEFTR